MARATAKRCPCQGQTLDRLVQPAILAFLARKPQNGYRVLAELAGLAMFRNDPPDRAGVYRSLKEMERRGLVRSTWRLSRAGPASRTFALTPAGRTCLVSWDQTLSAYMKELVDLRALVRSVAGQTR